MKRRNFINRVGLGTAAAVLPNTILSFTPSLNSENSVLNFGIIADVHKDLMPDANKRLEKFISEANHRKVDFIIQLGDFCMAEDGNKAFMNIWETYKGPK
ncbi:MAG: metallophosphoesterase, partial [Maribacter sp.]|nr:metallophosphoesterase [Maribacter sp.]